EEAWRWIDAMVPKNLRGCSHGNTLYWGLWSVAGGGKAAQKEIVRIFGESKKVTAPLLSELES
ncbi:MAG: hypothetical protein AAGF67_18295, partial [Verrucomicrobiota bacterium]